MVEHTLKTIDPKIPSRRSMLPGEKATRAEPISALYTSKGYIISEPFPNSEDQLCEWVPGVEKSPDRLDALVWALSKLIRKDKHGKLQAVRACKNDI